MIKNIDDMKNIISQGFKLGKQHKHFYCSNSNMKKDVIPIKLTHLNQCGPIYKINEKAPILFVI
jgi:hypothetical protein